MSGELVRNGELELPGDEGMRRIPWNVLTAMPELEVAAFQAALTTAVENNPRLEVVAFDDHVNNALVIKWRTRDRRRS